MQLVHFSKTLLSYKIEHFDGSPQGPSFSVVSDSVLGFTLGADVFDVFLVDPFSALLVGTFAVVATAPFVEPSSQKLLPESVFVFGMIIGR